jgi:NAD(P)-dependent dehydrogenase (short-subunit alcohol dehydrogenase family)
MPKSRTNEGSLALVAMVTGASRGIGRAIACALATDGYDVAITARTVVEGTGPGGLPGSLESTASAIEAAGRRALPVTLDLLDRSSLVPAVESVLASWGHIDVLVNNAIYVGPGNDDRFLDVDPENLERRIFANLTAQLLLSQRALLAMAERGTGTVINITSGAGLRDPGAPTGEPGGWALGYGASKGGFHRMAGVVAVELGDRGIRCFNVEPGFTATERVVAKAGLSWVAGRGKPPEVVGEVVAWLLRQADGTVANGSMVSVDTVAAELGLVSR